MSHLPPEEVVQLLRQLGPYSPASIPLLVQGLCAPRPEVAETAHKELQKLQQQWENQSWHQVSEALSVLAEALADQKANLPPHSRETARQLAEWILAWHPPEGSPERLRMIAACEEVLAYLEQTGGTLKGPSQNEASLSISQGSAFPIGVSPIPPIGAELLDPLDGFQWPGGGLPVVQLCPEGSLDLPPFGFARLPENEHRRSGQNSPKDSSLSQPLLRIREPMEADVFPRVSRPRMSSEEGDFSAEKSPRLNQAIRLPHRASEPTDIDSDSDTAHSAVQGQSLKNSPALNDTPPPAAASSSGSERQGDMRLTNTESRSGSAIRAGELGWASSSMPVEEIKKKDIGELLAILAAAAGEEQQVVQAELARRGFGHVSRQLAQQLGDPNPQARLQVVRRLPAMAGVEPVSWLFWFCRDPDPQVRSAAIALLATTKDPAILQELERILSGQPEEPLRRQTERLRTLGQAPLR